MAFEASNSSSEPRAFSIGPMRVQFMTYTAASADVSGTITADGLTEISHVILDGRLELTAAPTFDGNVATLAFTDPAADAFGTIMVVGR